jgi:hypothetical protein
MFEVRFSALNATIVRLIIVLWKPSTGTSHRLPKPVSRKQLNNRVTKNRNCTGNVRAISVQLRFTPVGGVMWEPSTGTLTGYPVIGLFPGYRFR